MDNDTIHLRIFEILDGIKGNISKIEKDLTLSINENKNLRNLYNSDHISIKNLQAAYSALKDSQEKALRESIAHILEADRQRFEKINESVDKLQKSQEGLQKSQTETTSIVLKNRETCITLKSILDKNDKRVFIAIVIASSLTVGLSLLSGILDPEPVVKVVKKIGVL